MCHKIQYDRKILKILGTKQGRTLYLNQSFRTKLSLWEMVSNIYGVCL
jgi:hypothetical protein